MCATRVSFGLMGSLRISLKKGRGTYWVVERVVGGSRRHSNYVGVFVCECVYEVDAPENIHRFKG